MAWLREGEDLFVGIHGVAGDKGRWLPSFSCHPLWSITYRSGISEHILNLGVVLVGDMDEEEYRGDGWKPFRREWW
jgi:hypothetical protein